MSIFNILSEVSRAIVVNWNHYPDVEIRQYCKSEYGQDWKIHYNNIIRAQKFGE